MFVLVNTGSNLSRRSSNPEWFIPINCLYKCESLRTPANSEPIFCLLIFSCLAHFSSYSGVHTCFLVVTVVCLYDWLVGWLGLFSMVWMVLMVDVGSKWISFFLCFFFQFAISRSLNFSLGSRTKTKSSSNSLFFSTPLPLQSILKTRHTYTLHSSLYFFLHR